jgi:hypothetical protein
VGREARYVLRRRRFFSSRFQLKAERLEEFIIIIIILI